MVVVIVSLGRGVEYVLCVTDLDHVVTITHTITHTTRITSVAGNGHTHVLMVVVVVVVVLYVEYESGGHM